MSEVAEQAKILIDDYFHDKGFLLDKIENMGISINHLSIIFKRYYKITPREYFNQRKFEYAKSLLAKQDLAITDIAEEVGYESLSSFYIFLKKRADMTPREYRKSLKDYA